MIELRNPKIRPVPVISFGLVHLLALGVLWVGFSWQGILLCLASYYLRMFAITAGFHRYFSHRAYRMTRVPQFLMAFLGQTSAQKGVLWWASNHRHHHRYSDLPEDIHSPIRRGFWWSHLGWILSEEHEHTNLEGIKDFAKFPELVWLDRNQYLATMLYACLLYALFGTVGLFYGYFLSTVLLWHGTFAINSVMHVFGDRAYVTSDQSRNSMIFALITMGEGWHNNHHYFPGTAAQGFRWWQIDLSYYILWLAERVGLVSHLRRVPARVKEAAIDRVASRVQKLSLLVDRMNAAGINWKDHALTELESARISISAQAEQLQAAFDVACRGKSRTSDHRLPELSAEIHNLRSQLAEILRQLVEAAEGLQTRLAAGPPVS